MTRNTSIALCAALAGLPDARRQSLAEVGALLITSAVVLRPFIRIDVALATTASNAQYTRIETDRHHSSARGSAMPPTAMAEAVSDDLARRLDRADPPVLAT